MSPHVIFALLVALVYLLPLPDRVGNNQRRAGLALAVVCWLCWLAFAGCSDGNYIDWNGRPVFHQDGERDPPLSDAARCRLRAADRKYRCKKRCPQGTFDYDPACEWRCSQQSLEEESACGYF